MNTRTVADVVNRLPKPFVDRLVQPSYTPSEEQREAVALAVESMKYHMTDEGWQIMLGLESAGYTLCGRRCTVDEVDVPRLLGQILPGIVVVQDKREWDVQPRDFRDTSARFTNVQELKSRPDVFKLTILKDSHQRPTYHRESADEIGCHAWIVYYHPTIVSHLAPYVRPEHLIRTYHTLDPAIVPAYSAERPLGCLISGAVSSAYPLRSLLVRKRQTLPRVDYVPHPGYHRDGCATPQYLQTLSRYKVAICTSSMYGYALRKIIEATACGCVVLTDLPTDEVLPEIDGNLVRISMEHLTYLPDILNRLYREYDPDRQRQFAEAARWFYDYRRMGSLLANDIETLRLNYNKESV